METGLPTQQNKASSITSRWWSALLQRGESLANWLAARGRGEKIVLVLLLVGLPLLVFYNLELNPRPWHDEGASLILARTLSEDGVYAMRSSDGYQTYGPVQSVGPTVIVPVALVYRWFGVGLLQGRLVVALYTLAALLLFYLVGQKLFDGWTAILGLFFLLAAPAVRIFIFGRQALGEVPGFALFLAGWLALSSALEARHMGRAALAGLLFGADIVTKSTYLVMIPATLGLVAILDLIYYRQSTCKALTLATGLALTCFFAWQAWQRLYFGPETYLADLTKLRQLAAVTTGFHVQTAISGVRSVLGNDSGTFYIYWGISALAYALILATRHSLKAMLLASIVIFTGLWLLYFMFWIVPWSHYAMPAMALTALMVAHLFVKLAGAATPIAWGTVRRLPNGAAPSITETLALGTLVGLFSFGLWAGFNFQQYLRSDVLDRTGAAAADLRSPPQLQNPALAAEYLKQNLDPEAVIETWERELGILTDLTYHYPDQSWLANTHALLYRGGSSDYQLGEQYFSHNRPDYLVIGWFARSFPIYDMDYVADHSRLVMSVGEGDYGYDIYQLNR